jgi:hypothetical protein
MLLTQLASLAVGEVIMLLTGGRVACVHVSPNCWHHSGQTRQCIQQATITDWRLRFSRPMFNGNSSSYFDILSQDEKGWED